MSTLTIINTKEECLVEKEIITGIYKHEAYIKIFIRSDRSDYLYIDIPERKVNNVFRDILKWYNTPDSVSCIIDIDKY